MMVELIGFPGLGVAIVGTSKTGTNTGRKSVVAGLLRVLRVRTGETGKRCILARDLTVSGVPRD
jgi:hypothetical protein